MEPGLTTSKATSAEHVAAHRVEVTPRSGQAKQRRVYRLFGFGPKLVWGIHDNNKTNLMRGLIERVFRVEVEDELGRRLVPPPRPTVDFGAQLVRFRERLRRWLPVTAPVDYDTFVGYYSGRQRTIYANAADSLRSTPVRRQDATVKTFVKAEKINLTKKPDPAPRVIQPRDPRYNVAVGVYLKPIEKLVYRAIAKVWGGPTVLKMNASQQGQAIREMWDSFHDPVAIGLDASRFDQHVSAQALEWEHSIYGLMFRGHELQELRRLLQWQIDNRGVAYLADAKVRYNVMGCRMSGDMNTSMGNCLLMSAMVWALTDQLGISARLANNGDDCVVIMERAQEQRFLAAVPGYFAGLGFTMKVEAPVYQFEHIEFCQTRPVWHPTGWIMTRDPRIAVSKDLTTLLDVELGYTAYCQAVGTCGLRMTGGMPVFQEFYNSMLVVGTTSKLPEHPLMKGGFAMLSSGMKLGYSDVHPQTRASFCFAFGILPDEQEALEAWLRVHPLPRTMKRSPTPISSLPNIWYT